MAMSIASTAVVSNLHPREICGVLSKQNFKAKSLALKSGKVGATKGGLSSICEPLPPDRPLWFPGSSPPEWLDGSPSPPEHAWRRRLNNHANLLKEFSVTFREAVKMYFLKTGVCKFGVACKFHHLRDKQIATQISLNMLGLPMHQSVALPVGDWFFDRVGVSAIDCPYLYDNTCHNLVFK